MAAESCFNTKSYNANRLDLSRFSSNFDIDDPPSPEMFGNDFDNDTPNTMNTIELKPSPVKLSREELIAKSDNMLHHKIVKYLYGIPPPPKHTTCFLNCNEIITLIHKNKDYFWINDPLKNTVNNVLETNNHSNDSAYTDTESANNDKTNDNTSKVLYHDELSKDSAIIMENNSASSETLTTSSQSLNSDLNRSKEYTIDELDEKTLLLYKSANVIEAKNMSFKEAYKHKSFGIHYNRNNNIEEFERMSVKLSERYINHETQSTCNVWFISTAAMNSAKVQNITEKNNGQSPGKRLNYLTKRRRTFSRANLQNLTAIDKKHRMFNYKKLGIRKGKSPRRKSPRGKSPRIKTPKSSTKKRSVKKLSMIGQNSHASKSEFPKRALFQSPPAEKAGSSQEPRISNSTPHTIKRALFSTAEEKQICSLESKKRKNSDPLDGPRLKWPRSLSFDCSRTIDQNSPKRLERLSTQHNLERSIHTSSSGKIEMSDTHRKKLLWAVAEALRGKGIGMGDPRFKQYASCLARTVKKYMPDLENRNIPRKTGSTTDRMLKLAKHHVYLVIEGKIGA